MSADYTGDDPFAVETYLKDTIAKEMSRKTILIGDVTGVHYIGDNSLYQSLTPQGSQANLSGVAIGVTTAAITILLLGLFMFLRKRSIPKDSHEVGAEGLEPIDDEDDDDDDDDEPEVLSTQSDEAVIGGNTTETTDPVNEANESPEGDETPLALPSRPKRTRKKKKKKKQKIIRVSSRSSISEMETITEEFEEMGEASTYCTTDDSSAEFQPHDPWISGPTGPARIPPLSLSNLSPLNEPTRMPPSPIAEERKIRRLPPPWL
jgi:hypothetical protein